MSCHSYKKKILVNGTGNTALDAANEAKRTWNKVRYYSKQPFDLFDFIMLLIMVAVVSSETCCKDYCYDVHPICNGNEDRVFYQDYVCEYDQGWIDCSLTKLKQRFVIDDDGDTIRCKQGLDRSISCEESIGSHSSMTYSGSVRFCNTTECVQSGFYNCFCEYGIIEEVERVKKGEIWFDVMSKQQVEMSNSKVKTSYIISNQNDEDDGLSRRSSFIHARDLNDQNVTVSEDVYVSLEDAKLKIVFSSGGQHVVTLRKGQFNDLVQTTDSTLYYLLPALVTATSGNLQITVFADSKEVYSGSVYVIGATICRLDQCTLCLDAWNNWSCLSLWQKVWIVLWLILMTCLLILVLKFIMYMQLLNLIIYPCSFCFRCCAGMYSSPLSNDLRKISRKVQNFQFYITGNPMQSSQAEQQKNTASILGVSAIPVEEYNRQRSTRGGRSKRMTRKSNSMENSSSEESQSSGEDTIINVQPKVKSNSRLNHLGILGLLMCCLICHTEACSDGFLIPQNTESCSNNGTSLSCTYKLEMIGKLRYPGDSICFVLLDSNSALFGSVKITYNYMEATLNTNLDYYTSDWKASAQSVKRCPGTTNCPSNCNSNITRSAYGELEQSSVINRPGETRCRRSCGCATCGCFLCSEGCVFSGFGMTGDGLVASVHSINSVTVKPNVRVEFFIGDLVNQTVWTTLTDFVSCTSLLPGAQVCITSSQVQFDNPFPDMNLMRYNDSTFVVQASKRNVPERGRIGDIQAVSQSALTALNPNSFIFAKDLFSVFEMPEEDIYTMVTPGLRSFSPTLAVKLPVSTAGNYWLDNYPYYRSRLSIAPSVDFSYSMNGIYYSSKRVSVVCPTFSVVSASGCYNCDMGATIVITARSTCTAGFLFLRVSDPDILLDTQGLAITMTNSDYTIRLRTPKAANAFTLYLAGSSTASDTITFTAISPSINLQSITYQEIINAESDKSSFEKFSTSVDDWFTKVFNGDATWWEYLLLGLGILLALVMVISAILTIKEVTKPIYTKGVPEGKSYLKRLWYFIKTKIFRMGRAKTV